MYPGCKAASGRQVPAIHVFSCSKFVDGRHKAGDDGPGASAAIERRAVPMTMPQKPALRPKNPRFSSGPCTKHPGWSVDGLKGALLGRYHRQPETKARLELALQRTRELLKLPAGYRAALVPASPPGGGGVGLGALV